MGIDGKASGLGRRRGTANIAHYRIGGAYVSPPARGPVLTGIDGKVNGFGRRRDNVSITHDCIGGAAVSPIFPSER